MKKNIILIVFIGLYLSSLSQKVPLKVSSNYFFVNPETGKQVGVTYDYIESDSDYENYIVCKDCSKNDKLSYSGGKWGLIDKYGTEIIPLKYSKIEYFNHNILLYINEKQGVANNRGEIVIPPVYNFLNVYELSNYYIGSNASNLYGLISTNGSVIIPFKYKQLILDNDYIIVESEKGKGLFNLNGEKILDEIYDDLEVVNLDNQIQVLLKIGSNSQLVDLKGKLLIDKYKGMEPFRDFDNNILGFWIKNKSLSGLISSKGEIILPPIYNEISHLKIDETNYFIVKKGKKYGVVDFRGKNKIPCKYDYIDIYPFGENLIVSNDGEFVEVYGSEEKEFKPKSYEIININGKKMFNKNISQYEYYFNYGKNNLIFNSAGLWGIIDQNFNIQLPNTYSSLNNINLNNFIVSTGVNLINNENMNEVFEGGAWDLLNSEFQVINKVSYESIDQTGLYPEKGLIVKKNGRFGMINFTGQEVIPCEFSGIECFENGCLVSKLDPDDQIEKYGFLDINSGKEIIPCIYDRLDRANYSSNNFIAVKGNKFGVIDMFGTILIDFKHEYLEGMFHDNYFITNKDGQVSGNSVEGGKYGLIDITGKEILKPEFNSFFLDKIDDFILCSAQNDKTKLFDMKKKIFIDIKDVEEFFVFEYGNFAIAKNIVKNSDGEIVSGLFGVMNNDYKITVPMIYSSVTYKKDYFIVFDSLSSTFDLFNVQGDKVLEKYNYFKSFNDSIVISSKDGQKFNLYDLKNKKQIFDKDYQYMDIIDQNLVVQNESGLKGIISLTGEILIPFKYCDIQYVDIYDNQQYIVSTCIDKEIQSVGKYGVIRTSGNSIIPIEYESIIFDPVKNQYQCFSKNKQVIFDIYGDNID